MSLTSNGIQVHCCQTVSRDRRLDDVRNTRARRAAILVRSVFVPEPRQNRTRRAQRSDVLVYRLRSGPRGSRPESRTGQPVSRERERERNKRPVFKCFFFFFPYVHHLLLLLLSSSLSDRLTDTPETVKVHHTPYLSCTSRRVPGNDRRKPNP